MRGRSDFTEGIKHTKRSISCTAEDTVSAIKKCYGEYKKCNLKINMRKIITE
jgi:hypothetical protein